MNKYATTNIKVSSISQLHYIAPGQFKITINDVFITHNGKVFLIMRYKYSLQFNVYNFITMYLMILNELYVQRLRNSIYIL